METHDEAAYEASGQLNSPQELEALLTVVRALLQDGKQDEAIAAYAAGTGVSQEEARQAVDSIGPNVFPEIVDEVKYLVDHGQKIAAIKKFREQTGAGLAEAKMAVEAMASGTAQLSAHTTDFTALAPELKRLVDDGQKIAAIKLFRARTGAGLAEAKAAVEAIAEGHAVAKAESLDVSADIKPLLEQGDKIGAIKLLRERTGMGLAEAKVAVELLAKAIQAGAAVPGHVYVGRPRIKTKVTFSFGKPAKDGGSSGPRTCPQCGDPLREGDDSCLACGWEPPSSLAKILRAFIALAVLTALVLGGLYLGGMMR